MYVCGSGCKCVFLRESESVCVHLCMCVIFCVSARAFVCVRACANILLTTYELRSKTISITDIFRTVLDAPVLN